MPKLGECVRCKRCGKVWEFVGCGDPKCNVEGTHNLKPMKQPTIADYEWEMCRQCGTDEELFFLTRHMVTHTKELN